MGFWQRALDNPDWVAVIEPDGTEHKAGDLLDRVNQIVHALRERGLTEGDGIVALIPNGIAPQELSLAALQAGWYYTPINWHFTPPEISYIVRDTQAKAFFVHERFAEAGVAAADEAGIPADARFSYGAVPGFMDVATLREGQPTTLPENRSAGAAMHYTSGTTGRPKGVRRGLTGLDPDISADLLTGLLQFFGITEGQPNVHLVTSPTYHTAVTIFGGSALQFGPRGGDMPALGLRRADSHPERGATLRCSVREIHPAGGVDSLHELLSCLVAGPQPERDEGERMRTDEFEAIVGRNPGGEFLRERDVTSHVRAEPFGAIPPDDGP